MNGVCKQLTELVARVHAALGGEFASRGRPYALGLFHSVALVVCLMRKNITQEFTGAIFGVSQPTVSRRWNLPPPVIGQVSEEFVPDLDQLMGQGTVLVDQTRRTRRTATRRAARLGRRSGGASWHDPRRRPLS